MRTRDLTLMLAGIAAITTACGSGTTTPATGALKSPDATPRTRNLERGEVVQIAGNVVTVTQRDGTDSDFDLTPSSVIQQQQDAALTDITVGTCAFGFGSGSRRPGVGADGDHRRPRPQGRQRLPPRRRRRVNSTGLAGGQVTASTATPTP